MEWRQTAHQQLKRTSMAPDWQAMGQADVETPGISGVSAVTMSESIILVLIDIAEPKRIVNIAKELQAQLVNVSYNNYPRNWDSPKSLGTKACTKMDAQHDCKLLPWSAASVAQLMCNWKCLQILLVPCAVLQSCIYPESIECMQPCRRPLPYQVQISWRRITMLHMWQYCHDFDWHKRSIFLTGRGLIKS